LHHNSSGSRGFTLEELIPDFFGTAVNQKRPLETIHQVAQTLVKFGYLQEILPPINDPNHTSNYVTTKRGEVNLQNHSFFDVPKGLIESDVQLFFNRHADEFSYRTNATIDPLLPNFNFLLQMKEKTQQIAIKIISAFKKPAPFMITSLQTNPNKDIVKILRDYFQESWDNKINCLSLRNYFPPNSEIKEQQCKFILIISGSDPRHFPDFFALMEPPTENNSDPSKTVFTQIKMYLEHLETNGVQILFTADIPEIQRASLRYNKLETELLKRF
jgi:hypothetical protein